MFSALQGFKSSDHTRGDWKIYLRVTQVREGTWKVAPLPADLLDRRVEITGPTDRKMVRLTVRMCRACVHGHL